MALDLNKFKVDPAGKPALDITGDLHIGGKAEPAPAPTRPPLDLSKPTFKTGFIPSVQRTVGGAIDAVTSPEFIEKLKTIVPKNIYEGLATNPHGAVPYAGEIYDIDQISKLKIVSDKMKAGTALPEEQTWANEYIKNHQAEQTRLQADLGYVIGNTVKQSVQFGLEILGAGLLAPETGGGSIAGLFATKGAIKGSKEVLQKIVTDSVARSVFTKEIGQWAAGTGIRFTIASGARIPSGAVERMVGTPIVNENGDFTGLAEDGQELPQAITNSVSSALVEYSSEFSGGTLSTGFSMLSAPVKNAMIKAGFIKAVLKKNPAMTPSMFEQVLKTTGWNGVLPEFGEERVADAMYAVLHKLGLSDQTFSITPEQIVAELASFGFMGTVFTATDKAIQIATKKKTVEQLDKEQEAEGGGIAQQVVADVKKQLTEGSSPADIALSLGQEIGTSAAEAVVKEAVLDIAQEPATPPPTTDALAESQKQFTELNKKVDETFLQTKASDFQEELAKSMDKQGKDTESIKQSIADLEAKLETAKPKTEAKKKLKIQLEEQRTALREAEAKFTETLSEHGSSVFGVIEKHVKGINADLSEGELSDIVDEVITRITGSDAEDKTVAEIADEVMSEFGGSVEKSVGQMNNEELQAERVKLVNKNLNGTLSASETKRLADIVSKLKGDKKSDSGKPTEGYTRYEITVQGVSMFADYQPDFIKGVTSSIEFRSKNGKDSTPISETGYKSHFIPGKFEEGVDIQKELQEIGEILAKQEKPAKKTQKEKVKEVVGKKGTATAKEIAEETNILEPNIRRILGVGAKEGEFERVADGVYRINVGDQEAAVIIPGDALKILPQLVKDGFKADMIFLDIPYKTRAVVGGNRGINYDYITPEEFDTVIEATKQIVRSEDSAVYYMFSQAESGKADMQKYTDKFDEHGFKPVARGEYLKTDKSGKPVGFPTRAGFKQVEPEGIILFNQSGKVPEKNNLTFKLVRPKGYQTEKPAELLKALIEMSTEEGDVVLDPFAGSGVAIDEAVKAGRRAVGIEKDKEQAGEIAKRVGETAKKIKPVADETLIGKKFESDDKHFIVLEFNELSGGEDYFASAEEDDFAYQFSGDEIRTALGIDNEGSSGNSDNNESTDNNNGSGDNGGTVSEPVPQGGKKPGGAGSTVGSDSKVGGKRTGKRSSVAGKRSATRLTNAEIEVIVKNVTNINKSEDPLTDGLVTITHEITDEVLEAANQYTPGGESKEGKGILDEYYTPPQVIDMVKSLLDFPAEAMTILEPSVGTGNFLDAVPDIGNHKIVALETNPLTARLAKIFHQDAEVRNKPFESFFIGERGEKLTNALVGKVDLVLGNPPYGDHRGRYLGLGEQSHIKDYETYFIKRGLSMLKPGGKLAMVVPSSFLRTMENKAKIEIAGIGILDVAYRLPEGVFSGTEIGTDIIVMHRRDQAKEMTDIVSIVEDNYFKENPSNVLGVTKTRKNRFGKMEKYVEGTIEDAIALFDQHKNDSEATTMLEGMGVETTPENVENTAEAITEAGESAEALVAEEEKQKKRIAVAKGKETVAKKIVKKAVGKKDTIVALTAQFGEHSEEELDLWRRTTPTGYVIDPTPEEKKKLNYLGGNYYLDFNYAQGDIYEKLEALARDKSAMTPSQYAIQKEKLEEVLPVQESIDDIHLAPNVDFVKSLPMGTTVVRGEEEPRTLQSVFLDWIKDLPREAFGGSSSWEVRSYTLDEQVRGNDKERNERERTRRKIASDSLFQKFLKEGITEEEQDFVKDSYNATFNFYHSPDYSKVPMFSEIYSNFKGAPFALSGVQKQGIGRAVNTGVGIIAHEVGFGKTISGTLANHEIMNRGWAKRPLIIAPNVNVYNQWIDTIQELVPKAQVNALGNLGASYKGDLSSLKIPEGSFTVLTYEGFKRLSFTDETYSALSSKFGYISDDLTKHKTARDEEKAKAKYSATGGTMKKGTRGDLFFENLGFDLLTFDELHNANHIVSKVKLKKGQASEFNRFSLRPSDLGLKTWLASQYIQKQKDGRNFIGLSATPFTNNPLEYYSVLSLVADKSLTRMGLGNVNDFFGTFMDASNDYEFKADGTYEKKTDIRGFRNYRQFRKLLDSYIDFKDIDESIVRPNRVQRTYEIPQNQLGIDAEKRAQEIFSENEREDGKGAKVLRAITELRKIAFSPFASKFSDPLPLEQYKRFVESSPKIQVLMGLIAQNKKDQSDAGQIVYVDQVGVSYLPHMKAYLTKELGYTPAEVEIISGATPKEKRPDIQDRFNQGKVKIILGSEAIKEGMNLQQNTTDLYILSLPWNFTQLRQVIGRAWRQGNDWKNVRVNNLFTQDSVDIFLSQKLENKQKRYEAAIKSGEQEVDVGDISYDEMKFDLVRDPEVRAKYELQAEKERLTNLESQARAEVSFATRKLEKVGELDTKIANSQEQVNDHKKRFEEAQKKGLDTESLGFWINRYEADLKKYQKEKKEELDKLGAKGIDTSVLMAKRTEGEAEIAELQSKIADLDISFDERVKKIAASFPPRQAYSPEVVAQFVAERAEHNKEFYTRREIDSDNTVAIEANRAVKKPRAVVKKREVKEEVPVEVKESTSRDTRTLTILADKSLTVNQKVDSILNTKQEGKAFKDTGERVAGSKKERAAVQTIMDNADASVIAEVISRLGAGAVAETLRKEDILEDVKKPDFEADKAKGVPAFIAGWKVGVLNTITRVPVLSYKRGRYTNMLTVDEKFVQDFLTQYPTILRTFVSELEKIKTVEDIKKFNDFYGGYKLVEITNGAGEKTDISIQAIGKTIQQKIRDGIRHAIEAQETEEKQQIINQGYVEKIREYNDSKYYLGINGRGYTHTFDTKDEAIAETSEDKDEAQERVTARRKYYFDEYEKWAPKQVGVKTVETELKHGNFKPMEHIVRTGEVVPDEKLNADTLTKELGFKSVQFGNYMDDATAREHIRHTIGAVYDMSNVLNIDFPKLMQEKGLSIAYGARGGGSANAHYEPTHNIINLTKGRGDGSFFHEFVHFLDRTTATSGYREKWSSKKDRYYRSNPLDGATYNLMGTITGNAVRMDVEFTPSEEPNIGENNIFFRNFQEGITFEQAIERTKQRYVGERTWQEADAYRQIADVYRKTFTTEAMVFHKDTNYHKGAKSYGGNYWSEWHEMLARAGQAYIQDKLAEAKMQNDYLTRDTKTTDDDKTSSLAKVYPQGEERKRINKAFDKVFDVLREKYPLSTEARNPIQKTFNARYKERVVEPIGLTEAGKFLKEFKARLNLDFDVYFADTIFGGTKRNLITKVRSRTEAEGATLDNTIVIAKDAVRFTAEHEVVHLTLANMSKIPIFARNGLTREKVMQAQAKKMGIELTDKTDSKIDEALAQSFEAYLANKEQPVGLLAKFFMLLKRSLQKLMGAIKATDGSILQNYFDILLEGEASEFEHVELENSGVIKEFVDDNGIYDMEAMEASFKERKGDGRLRNISEEYQSVDRMIRELEGSLVTTRKNLEAEIAQRQELEAEAGEVSKEIKELARFTIRSEKSGKVGKFTSRGEAVASSIGEVAELQAKVNDYLFRKVELNESRRASKALREDIKKAKEQKIENKAQLKELARRITARRIRLEQMQKDVARGMEIGARMERERLLRRNKNVYLEAMRAEVRKKQVEGTEVKEGEEQSVSAIKKDIHIIHEIFGQAHDLYADDPVAYRAAGMFLDIANQRRENKQGIDNNFSEILKPYFELKNTTRVNVALMDGDKEAQEFNNSQLDAYDLNAEEKKAYHAVRNGFSLANDLLIKQMREQGYPEKTVLRYKQVLEGYMPHKWVGRFVVKTQKRIEDVEEAGSRYVETDASGQIWVTETMDAYKSKKEAILAWEKARKGNKEIADTRFKLDTLDSVDVDFFSEQNLALKNIQTAISHAKAPEEIKKLMEDAIDDLAREKGYGRHYIHRTGIQGYEEKQVPMMLAQYFTGFSGYLTKMQAAPLLLETLKHTDPRRQAKFHRWLREAIAYDMSSNKELDMAKRVAFIYMLANDVSFLLTNMTQNFIVGTGELSKIGGVIEPETQIIKAMSDWTTGRLTPEEKAETTRLIELGHLGGEMTSELMGYMHNPLYRSVSSTFTKALYWSTAFVEQNVNRVPAFLAARRMLAKHKNLKGAELNKSALEISDNIHFRYGKQHRPSYQRGRKGVLFVFTHYIRSLLYLMARNLGEREFTAVARMMFYTLVFGGATALPFAVLFKEAYKWLFGDDGEPDKKELALWEIALQKGIPAAFNVDLSGRVGIGIFTLESIAQDPTNVVKYLGSLGGLGERLYSSYGLMQQDRYTESLAKLTPDMVGNWMKAWYGYDIGIRSKFGNFLEDSDGEPMKYTASEAFIRGLGFSPTRESLAWEAKADEFDATDKVSAERQIIRRKIQEAVLQGDDEGAMAIETEAKANGKIKSDYVYEFKKDKIIKEAISADTDVSEVIDELSKFKELTASAKSTVKNDYRVYTEFGLNDEFVNDLQSTQTNADKVEKLLEYRGEVGQEAFDEFFDRGRSSGLISKPLAKAFAQAEEQ